MRRLPTGTSRPKAKKSEVLGVLPKMEGAGKRAQTAGLPRSEERSAASAAAGDEGGDTGFERWLKGLRREPQEKALDLVFSDAIADGEGTSTGAVGSKRYGKTTWTAKVLARAIAEGVADQIFVHDVKKAEPQYDGVPVESVEEWIERYEDISDARMVVFHSADLSRKPSLQDVCEVAREEAADGKRVLVVADEVFKGTNGFGGWKLGVPDPDTRAPTPAMFPEFIREGSSQGISTAWTTQRPQILPGECKDLPDTVAILHLEGLAADAACRHWRLEPEHYVRKLLTRLKRGEFLLYSDGQEWNRTIYFEPSLE